jgi:hypothetical protein
VNFALVAGEDLTDLLANTARAWEWMPSPVQGSAVGEDQVDAMTQNALRLQPSRPNPFYETAVIRYALPQPSPVSLRVLDVGGRVVRTLLNEVWQQRGEHSIAWDGRDEAGRRASRGVYFLNLRSPHEEVSDRILLMR